MKVIAIIDKPANCSRCPFNYVDIAIEKCMLSRKQLSAVESLMIPEWCELKPIPQKKDTFGKLPLDKMAEYIGWNDCLGAITGDEE